MKATACEDCGGFLSLWFKANQFSVFLRISQVPAAGPSLLPSLLKGLKVGLEAQQKGATKCREPSSNICSM